MPTTHGNILGWVHTHFFATTQHCLEIGCCRNKLIVLESTFHPMIFHYAWLLLHETSSRQCKMSPLNTCNPSCLHDSKGLHVCPPPKEQMTQCYESIEWFLTIRKRLKHSIPTNKPWRVPFSFQSVPLIARVASTKNCKSLSLKKIRYILRAAAPLIWYSPSHAPLVFDIKQELFLPISGGNGGKGKSFPIPHFYIVIFLYFF